MANAEHDLPVAFQFKVVFTATMGNFDSAFQEVSGIAAEMKTSSYKEGGENRYTHTLPEQKEQPKLLLQRGLAGMTSPLVMWCKSVLEGDLSSPMQPMLLQVFALNEKGLPSAIWTFDNAFPVSWKLGTFNATKNEVAIETIELSYNTVLRMM